MCFTIVLCLFPSGCMGLPPAFVVSDGSSMPPHSESLKSDTLTYKKLEVVPKDWRWMKLFLSHSSQTLKHVGFLRSFSVTCLSNSEQVCSQLGHYAWDPGEWLNLRHVADTTDVSHQPFNSKPGSSRWFQLPVFCET